jgi:tRNA(adenine34) deaminase
MAGQSTPAIRFPLNFGHKVYTLPGLNYCCYTILYVTVEPCIMCMGAIVHARVSRLVYGVADPKWGAAGSLYNYAVDDRLNHRVAVEKGICEQECRALLQDFFRAKRG